MSSTRKVLCFGEVLLRICPDTVGHWIGNKQLPVYIGGAELNVCRALAKWKVPVSFLSSLPDNLMASQVIKQLEQEHIDTSPILRTGKRMGLYFLPQGEQLQQHGVVYDREGSSFSELKRDMIDWEKVLKGVSWFHLSAINPALNNELAWVCEEGMKAAKILGCTVSIDLNYRQKLWKNGRDPRWVMESLLPYCDVVMGNVWAADQMLGIEVDDSLNTDEQEACVQHAFKTSHRIMDFFPDVKMVFNTFRFEKNGLRYFATLNTADHKLVSKNYVASEVTDKVGSGDCFMAGIIYGSLNGLSEKDTLEFATSAAFQKLFTRGDANVRAAEEVVLFAEQYAV